MKDTHVEGARAVKLITIAFVLLGLFVGVAHSFSSGPLPGRTGAPRPNNLPPEQTCNSVGCHNSFPLNPDSQGRLELTGLPDNYLPGTRYNLTVSLIYSLSDQRRWGFQLTALAAQTLLPGGEILVTDNRNTQVIPGTDNRSYLEHTSFGTFRGRMNGSSWTFDWLAPSTNLGDVAFYGAGNAANANNVPTGDKIYSPSPVPVAVTKGQVIFADIASAANIASASGSGVAVGDYDGDRHADMFIAGDGQYWLFRNDGRGIFEDVAQSAGLIAGDDQGRAAAWGDYDGDNDLDLYVVNAGADRLYRNNGDGTFSDASSDAGVSDDAVGHSVVWGDLDGDGQADLYVANDGQDTLYLNNMNGTFSAADPATDGLAEEANSWSVALADYNGDGRVDIYVANAGPDALYRNNGDSTFSNVSVAAGVAGGDTPGRAVAWVDFNQDGHPDVFVANLGQDRLYRNNGGGTFTDVTVSGGMGDMAEGSAAAWGDYDGDGDPDLFVANVGQDFLYRNNGNGTFNQVATHSGMTDGSAGKAARWIDANSDGQLDLFVANSEGGNFLYLNPGQAGPRESNGSSQVTRVVQGTFHNLITQLSNWIVN